MLREANLLQEDAMGSLGKLRSVEDLPPKKKMVELVKQALVFIDSGQYTSSMAARGKGEKAPVAAIEMPAEFTQALKANKKAAAVFAELSPNCTREYTDWIAEAKRPETRNKRVATAMEWISEGKQRNWKYQNC